MAWLKDNYKYLIFMFILIIVNGLLLVDKFSANKYILILFSIMTFIEVIGVIFLINRKFKVENIFLIIGIPIGLLYLIFLPIDDVPDEANHFLRAYEITEGHLISQQDEENNGYGYFTEDINKYIRDGDFSYKDTLNDISQKNEGNDTKYVYSNISLYSFICYTPQALGIFVAKLLNLSVLWQAYFARLFNFAVWVLMVYFALKILPRRKIAALFIMLLPIVMQEATSMAADCLTIGTALLLVSYILKLAGEKDKKLTKKQEIFILGLSILMSLCKIVYLPLCFIIILLPNSKFKTKKERIIKTVICLAITIAISLTWISIASRFLIEINEGVNSAEQVKHVITNPIKYLVTVSRTIDANFQNYSFNIVGSSLGCFDIELSKVYVISILIYMFIVFLNGRDEEDSKGLSLFDIIVISIIGLTTIALIFTSIYVQWEAVGAHFINGVQARYFIPILFFIPLILSRFNIKHKFDNKYMYIMLLSYNIYALNVIFSHFI